MVFPEPTPGTTQDFKIKRSVLIDPALMAGNNSDGYLCFDIGTLLEYGVLDALLHNCPQAGSIKIEHDTPKGCKVQTDIRWTFHHSQGESQVFAVLELKAPNLLAWDDSVRAAARCEKEVTTKLNIQGTCGKSSQPERVTFH